MRTYRLAWLAVAFAVGIAVAQQTGPLSRVVLPWCAAAAAVLLWSSGRGVAALVAMALLGGAVSGSETARLELGRRALFADARADDRGLDLLVGVVAGPVERAPGMVRFSLATGGPIVRVTAIVTGEQGGHTLPLPGDRVQVVGRLGRPAVGADPGQFDRARWLASRGAALELRGLARDLEVLGAEWSLYRGPGRWQRRWSDRMLQGRAGSVGAAVVASMVVGDRGQLSPEVGGWFRDAGVAHVLAVSGLHLAATALLAFVAIRRLWAAVPALALRADAFRAAALGAMPIAVGYTLVTGARVSTVRALVVVLIVLAGLLMRRRPRLLDSLGCAALVVLASAPSSLFDPSFQLSFGATAVLALTARRGGPTLEERLYRRLARRLWDLLRASLWVTLALAPFTAAAFGQVQTGGPLVNLVVVPLAELVVLPCGLLGVALSELWPAAGGLLIDVAVAAAELLVAVARQGADWFPVLQVPPPNSVEWLAAGVALGGLIAGSRSGWRSRRALAAALVGAAVIAASVVTTFHVLPRLQTGMTVTFLDVGHGDAAVIELPGGGAWLIDAGGRPYVTARAGESDSARAARTAGPGRQIARFLQAQRIRRIELAVVSHAHPDHYAGLSALAAVIPVRELWVAESHPEQWSPQLAALLVELQLRGTRVVVPPLGLARTAGGVDLEVLGPRYESERARVDPVLSVNDNSLVVSVAFAGRRILFAGDLEEEGEQRLAGRLESFDVVKVPHHGSRTSSTAAFVGTTGPQWAVVSCGRANRFGLPHDEVLARWRAVGAALWRTDQRGAARLHITAEGGLSLGRAGR